MHATPSVWTPHAGTPSSSGNGSSREDITLDIVIGGWREGSTRAWVEKELAQLISFVELSATIY